ncbi:translation initiation factor IF-2 [Candidatus Woesearchaeota archaeon CG08_land_8_20_14_0_20_47_9]|nr:MAG: translation initiation factor IF-2 [Candidatus Woesearchaeota archaeon CG08_land_8_20_14_0_20_47_9]HII29828.1 translation initiation factor IF-2 [Candidatus Woesearchaeota archaeon]
MLRKPIVTFMGHVDGGKTSLQDFIRKTTMVAKEPGEITQAIGASLVPIEVVNRICGELLTKLKRELTLPGLLLIDTPGHAAFTTLRKRGGNLADIAILVIDINEGVMPQTGEAIEILKSYKTPFVIAANKIDLVSGWRGDASKQLLQNIESQHPETITLLEKKMYEIVARLSEFGLNSERFDRVENYTKQIAIIPCCAKTGEGIPELLMVLTGLAQRFLTECLSCDVHGPAKGTVLEVKEEKGLGKLTMDVIIYDGSLQVNDIIVIGGLTEPIVTRVRALFEPMPLAEMRDSKSKFMPVKEAFAATGVKIAAPDVEGVFAGMPLLECDNDKTAIEKAKKAVMREVGEVVIEGKSEGLVVKTDSLGSLEAMINLLKAKSIPIRKASIGAISKKDVSDAEANYEANPLQAVVLGFNVTFNPEVDAFVRSTHVKIFTNSVIYRLIEDFEAWMGEERSRAEARELDSLVRPAKIQILRGYVFRQNNPAIVGVEILAGRVRTGIPIIKEGASSERPLTHIKSMQAEKENVTTAEEGKQLAISLEHVTVGRQINEGDILYAAIPEEDFRKLKGLKKYLSDKEKRTIKEYAEMIRASNPMWGV